MHNVSELYRSLLANKAHKKEVKLIIAGTEYSQKNIISVNVNGGLFDDVGIGNCLSREANIELFQISDIPKQAKIEIYVRLVCGESVSEWVPKGVFFISTRKKNKISNALQITAYDAMLKAEGTWLDGSHDPVSWPMPQQQAVQDIANKIGIGIDQRTILTSSFPVEFPVGEEGDYSMREVLANIAVSNAGNWIITDEGKLRLIKLGDIPDETSYLIDNNGSAILFGEVRLIV